MKQVYEVAKTELDAKNTVKFLISMGISAYRQGRTVWVDDGEADEAL